MAKPRPPTAPALCGGRLICVPSFAMCFAVVTLSVRLALLLACDALDRENAMRLLWIRGGLCEDRGVAEYKGPRSTLSVENIFMRGSFLGI